MLIHPIAMIASPSRDGNVRVLLASMTLFAHLVALIGYPALNRSKKLSEDSRPYPCMDRPCACKSYDECWAGDCCCFTMSEKLAWAKAHGITPPRHAVEREKSCEIASSKPESRSCCREPKKPACPLCESPVPESKKAMKWVHGVFQSKCRGENANGLMASPPAVPPEAPFALWKICTAIAWIFAVDDFAIQHPQPPTPPPPR